MPNELAQSKRHRQFLSPVFCFFPFFLCGSVIDLKQTHDLSLKDYEFNIFCSGQIQHGDNA